MANYTKPDIRQEAAARKFAEMNRAVNAKPIADTVPRSSRPLSPVRLLALSIAGFLVTFGPVYLFAFLNGFTSTMTQ
jgi:hypothetical protein